MSYEQKRKDIQKFFADNFTGVATDKIAWDNVSFDIPKQEEPWVRLSIQNNISDYVSTGPNRRTRRKGLVFVQIFVPENSETLISSQLCDDVVDIFETKLLNGVVFFSPNVREIGNSDGWYQVNISVDFYFDDITTIT